MNRFFSIKDKIYDITEKYPETIDVFVLNGFEQFKNDSMRQTMGKTISLEIACKSKEINIDLFSQKLVSTIEENRSSVDLSLKKEQDINGEIKIEGVLPCPVRMPLMEGFNKWLEENRKKFEFKISYDLKSANMGVDWIKDRIESEDENSLSDLFMSAGFDLFFDKELMGKFKEKEVFEDLTGLDKLNKNFDNNEIDLKDPKRQYSIIAVVPAVFMVNTEELRGREIPQSWEDLLDSQFENSVSLPMKDFDLFNAILLNIYKRYGENGIKSLGKSLLYSMHPAEMVKSHIKKDSNIPTVTIMPYFFTKMVRSESPLKPIWPQDGAIISPIFLLTKKETKERTKVFVDYFFSKEVGEILSHNGRFPSTNPYVNNRLSEEKKFMWLGWDYINSHDIGELIRRCEKIFYNSI